MRVVTMTFKSVREAFLFVLKNQLFRLCNFLEFLGQVVVLFWEILALSFVLVLFVACAAKSLCLDNAPLQTDHVLPDVMQPLRLVAKPFW